MNGSGTVCDEKFGGEMEKCHFSRTDPFDFPCNASGLQNTEGRYL